jgi:hypothetical protein
MEKDSGDKGHKHQADPISVVSNEKKELFQISNLKIFSEAIGTDFFTGILTYCVTFISIYTILFLPMDILRIIPKINYQSFGLVNRIYHSKLSVCSISSIIMVILICSMTKHNVKNIFIALIDKI